MVLEEAREGGRASRGSFLERKKLLRCTTFDVLVRTAPSPTFRHPMEVRITMNIKDIYYAL